MKSFLSAIKLIFLLFIVCPSIFIENAHADMVSTTTDQLKQNKDRIISSLNELKNDLTKFKDDCANQPNEIKDYLKQYEKLLSDIKPENLENLDINNIKERLQNLKKDFNDGTLFKNIGETQKGKFGKIINDFEKVVRSIKNILSVYYTTPVGLKGGYGNTGLEIAIDTLRYVRTEDGGGSKTIDVRADFQLPFSIAEGESNTKIGFLGTNIPLSGKEEAKIMLDTKNTTGHFTEKRDIVYFPILSGKAQIGVHADSYIGIDCNGFTEMFLKGEFVFNSDVIYPADTTGKDTCVTAYFELKVSDLEDIVIETGFKQPFKIKCTGDITYEVYGVVADFSTVKNASDFEFPPSYDSPFKGEDKNYWTGFALKTLRINVEDEIPFIDTLLAYNMLIDETGISGWFEASFGQDKGELKTGVIDTKINKIAVAVANNKVVGGGIEGRLDVKALKDADGQSLDLDIMGTFYSDCNRNFCYSIEVNNNLSHTYNLPFLQKSEVRLGAGTSIVYKKEMRPDSTYKKGFFFNLNGDISLGCSFLTLDGLGFQDLQLSTCAPYFGGGKFALNSAKTLNLGALEIELLNVYAAFDTTMNKRTATFGAEVNVKLIGEGKGVSCGGRFYCPTDVENGWKPTGIQVEKISLDLDFSAFHLSGSIEKHDGELTYDNKYGRGFGGGLEIRMDALNIDVKADALFGKTMYHANKPYKYWYVYANVGVPPSTLIFPPAVMLNSVSLLLYSRMAYTVDQTTKEVKRDYYPDPNMAFGFQAGVKVHVAQENMVGAEMKLGMDFSSGGGVKNINLEGGIYMLAEDQKSSIVNGTVRCFYDFEEKIFKFTAPVEAKLACIKGNSSIEIYSDPKIWYFHLGTFADPSDGLKFAGIAKAKAYFMFGHNIPSVLPPLDSRITELFEVTQSSASGHEEEFKTGNGFAFGAAVSVSCGFNKFIYAGVDLLGGIDVLVTKHPGMNCEGSSYRGYGRAYVWLDLGAGVQPRKKKYEFLEVSAAAEVNAEFPKPLYLNGRVAFRYSVLGGLFSGSADTDFEAGNTCDWTGNGIDTSNDGEYDFSQYKYPTLDIDLNDGENFEKLLEEAEKKKQLEEAEKNSQSNGEKKND